METRPSQQGATQELTQQVLDPRRTGGEFSDLSSTDVADVICILHPCSQAALEIAARTAQRSPQHVLQFDDFQEYDDDLNTLELNTQQTFILPENQPRVALDLALRFSSKVRNVANGFIFGRNAQQCDLVFDTDTIRRVSNLHFRIFINPSGVLMLHDTSTNGTLVDDVLLQGRRAVDEVRTRMLKSGSVIQILSQKPEELIKFIVRIPSRNGYEREYENNFRSYMQDVAALEQLSAAKAQANPNTQMARLAQLQAAGIRSNTTPSTHHPLTKNDWGMHWNGGSKYNVVGHLGRGAFATVFQVATKADGHLFAAKELEKRKFMKNGVLDRKLDNEMQIMKDLSHENIVQYVEYHDHDKHLYIIMEYVGCGDLQQYISNVGPLPEQLARTMAAQVLDALSYLHTKRITHRDIKPDNILIADVNPENFWVKLSDFGLSKVVKDNDTFLKTFCGTLLYCAPEVFPHYDAHVAQHGGLKRPRQVSARQQKTYHSYSQSVDVWSFGAVLWFALCGKTPFDGVMDTTGRGMFERIMQTPLDPNPLIQHGVSTEATELLYYMLRTNPAQRPPPAQCLQHPWFFGLPQHVTNIPEESELGAIDEEEEDDELLNTEEPDLSQLRIDESGSLGGRAEVSFDSSDLDFLDPRQSKRFKMQRSSSQPSGSSGSNGQTKFQGMSQGQPRRPMLFGEVTESPLNQKVPQNDGRARSEGDTAGDENSANSSGKMSTGSSTDRVKAQMRGRPDSFTISGQLGDNSLSGAESMVRDLNMDSPQSANTPPAEANEPRTPGTPDGPQQSSLGNSNGAEETPTKAQEVTPRPVPFSRQIDLPLPASFFYDPHDPTTHNPEYASARSGHDFLAKPTLPSSSFDSFARVSLLAAGPFGETTQNGLETDDEDDLDGPVSRAQSGSALPPPLAEPFEFAVPAPRLGKLISTPDSYADITLTIKESFSTWGRAPNNTFVYENPNDIRVPKRGIIIWFVAPGLTKPESSGQDWTKLPNLSCTIATESRHGIYVNKTKLTKTDEKGRLLYGRLYHGDLITVTQGRKKGTELAFKVEIYHGVGKNGRKDGDSFRVEIDEKKRSESVEI